MLSAVSRKASTSLFPAFRAAGALRMHCQVPCGIFDDPVRVLSLKEDAATVRKAMVQINELSAAGTPLALNQATRWVNTKEDHANSIMTTVSMYMLAQRVKKEIFETPAEYEAALVAHHTLLTSAMKTKQVVDVAACDVLDSALEAVGKMYTK
mmetsp:Transcript_51960/g.111060  ORF Transcript_51960/g.111060 Transcript_51960/m.111060 type:complete len:153 (-) Transcript_51960:65-523(-)|eukprot:CAMPEP_0183349962 /NCGR_PEP_ID=MMETSP0164_2-20130417/15492_1 /TAXON_ID=221442 /ORGANISM="Coccolithus pelagicus ssp braarudi, Strain PLY182g" /LENGTH=152 /DNA_ID=CAMNT_0025521789 /DNA_START=33 /DNA_END=491 /DNA_ORIENTATION=+